MDSILTPQNFTGKQTSNGLAGSRHAIILRGISVKPDDCHVGGLGRSNCGPIQRYTQHVQKGWLEPTPQNAFEPRTNCSQITNSAQKSPLKGRHGHDVTITSLGVQGAAAAARRHARSASGAVAGGRREGRRGAAGRRQHPALLSVGAAILTADSGAAALPRVEHAADAALVLLQFADQSTGAETAAVGHVRHCARE